VGAVTGSGRIPLLTWEPWTPGAADQPRFRLRRIAEGAFDAYIASWADQLKAVGTDVYLRPMHEMNGNWYAWSGNPAAYVAAWRHLHDIFVARGATNASWVWVVNADDAPTTNTMESYWPGAGYVDVLGMDGYNCYYQWRSFETILKRAYTRITALDPALPVWVVETGTCEPTAAIPNATGHTKAEWIRDAYASTAFPRLRALMWFNESNPSAYDWRLTTSATALAEIKTQLRAAAGWVAAPAPVQPPRPTGVTVTADGTGAATLRWQPATAYLAGYKLLQKAPDATAYGPTYSIAKTATEYRVTGLTPGLTYKFVMQAYTAVSTSLLSDALYHLVPDRSLAMPRGVTGTATQTRANLKWTAVDGATSYQVFSAGTLVATTTIPAYTSPLLDPGTPWSYSVVAADGDLVSVPSATVSGVTTSATPTGVTVSLIDGKPYVSWNPVAGATGYRVVRDGALAATVAASGSSWHDVTATAGSTYAYSVASYNSNSQSGRMAAVTVTVP
jgi:hypothetical protein